MEDEMKARLLACKWEDWVKGHSGIRLGAKNAARVLNVKPHLCDKKDAGLFCNIINYFKGLALATNGYFVYLNLEDYSPIYENTLINYLNGDITQVGNFEKSRLNTYSEVMSQMAATHWIEADDMLQAIDEQAKMYDTFKANDPSLADDMLNGYAGLICFGFGENRVGILPKHSKVIKQFVELCKKKGSCAIGFVPFRVGVIKIVGEGMALTVLGVDIYTKCEPNYNIDVTNKIKPINE